MNRKSLFTYIAGTLLGILLLPSLASALGTPDELPPPMEDVCNSETGAGYGLCNAYCQAMDCESASPSATDTACQKVADKYQQLTGNLVPPCACPMMAYPSFSGLVLNPSTIVHCEDQNVPQTAIIQAWGADPVRAAVWDSFGNYAGNDDTTAGSGGDVTLSYDEFKLCYNLLSTACGLDPLDPINYP